MQTAAATSLAPIRSSPSRQLKYPHISTAKADETVALQMRPGDRHLEKSVALVGQFVGDD
jgi:hypothetical protein